VNKKTTKLLLIAGLVVIILGGFVVELPFSMNYLQAESFLAKSFGLGLLLGLLAAGMTLWFKAAQIPDLVARLQLFFTILISLSLLTPLITSWVNRIGIGSEHASPTELIFESEQARYTSRFGESRLQKQQASQYLLFFYRDGQLYRISDDEPFGFEAETGDTITLAITRGRLGYEWVDR